MDTGLVLGIDCSTQSFSGVVVDPDEQRIIGELGIPYRDDPRVNGHGIDFESLVVPPRIPGEADQPPLMFLSALDALLTDMKNSDIPVHKIASIAVSAQQHGHVYLAEGSNKAFGGLTSGNSDLVSLFRNAFSYQTAPIWQTADTAEEASQLRTRAGGTQTIVAESGSNSPLRFTGAVIRRIAKRYPEIYRKTVRIHLLSSFLSGVLAGNPECPIDWGNGSGMSLMNYTQKEWSDLLLKAVAGDLPEGASGLRNKLPDLGIPTMKAGTLAPYFVKRYGFSPSCTVTVGSGDNPQSKNLFKGDLLSIGTSFVYMVDTGKPLVDYRGYANSMYDGLGRPFVFACRTNGALVWDRVMSHYQATGDFKRCTEALKTSDPRENIAIWHPYPESYPESPALPHREIENGRGNFEQLYSAVVDSSLVLTWYYASGFDSRNETNEYSELAVTGGPSSDIEILRRIAAIWKRPVVAVGKGGAGLGSAISAYASLGHSEDDQEKLRKKLLPVGKRIEPDMDIVEAFHGKDGAVPRIVAEFSRLTGV